MSSKLQSRSIRTLAWLGDVEFERETRFRIAKRADFRSDRLDRIRARVVCAEGQARLLASIESQLSPEEESIVRRGRNATLSGSRRLRRNVRDYRSATGFEALIAYWVLEGEEAQLRMYELLGPHLEAAIDEAIASTA